MAIIGNQFEEGDSITGIEIKTKVRGDSISVWNKDATNDTQKESVKQDFLKALNAPEGLVLEYENFKESIAGSKKSGYKNKGGRRI